MTKPATYRFEPAEPDDLPAILEVQRRAFGRVAYHFGIPEDVLPPMREDLSALRALMDSGTRFFVVRSQDARVLGSVRADFDGVTVSIGRLVVDDDMEGRGIGSALMLGVERAFPHAQRFELFTGEGASRPIALYERLGYRLFRKEPTPDGFMLVFLEKRR